MRVLILTASVGAGHVRAAEALEVALRELRPDAEVRRVDVLTLTNAVFRRLYGQAYLDLVRLAPHLVGAFYDHSDRPLPTRGAGYRLRHLVQRRNLARVVDLVDEGWDLVVHTHFLAPDLLASMARRGRRVPRQATVVTDFDAHAFWAVQPCERFFVPTEEAALSLAHWGVPRGTIEVTGIPIHPVFARPLARAEALRRHGLSGDRPVLLVLGGGFGVGPVEKIFEGLLALERPAQVVAVCGRNEALQARLGKVKAPPRHRAVVMGFTTAMDELLAAADLVVTKPGGLTTSECLARGAAMVIMNPIPGQESRNSDWLLEHGAAVKSNAVAALAWKISGVLDTPGRLAVLRAAAAGLGRPRAAYDVAGRVLEMAGGSPGQG